MAGTIDPIVSIAPSNRFHTLLGVSFLVYEVWWHIEWDS
ncbi:hypothetical protein HOV93_14490 [Planctomycetes bacterium FF15]|uniref:Uncharacterized protein n=1 Tax=Bremerella alba TaxID=980252 RepID=A0A7V9A6G6_9BACT|nr:hypothetical protein [Bremerella alba]